MVKAFIFDLDGVLVDTAKYHYLAWKRLSEELGLQFNLHDNEMLKGVSRTKSFEIILGLNNREMSEEEIDKYCTIKNNYYLDYINKLRQEELMAGAGEFLENARKKGFKIALGSASKNSMLILEKLNILDLFDAVIDGRMVKNAKPDPEIFLKGAQALKVLPEECIVYEDSLAGITAAHNGGMKAIGVNNNDIRPYCDYYIDNFINADPVYMARKVLGE
jgi:beta-phosphoglucomutase